MIKNLHRGTGPLTRREMLKGACALAVSTPLSTVHSLLTSELSTVHSAPTTPVNLVPALSTDHSPLSYWCTWGTQIAAKSDDDNATIARLNEKNLLDNPGWASNYYDKVRGDLLVVLDEGWDVGLDFENRTDHWKLGSLELATDKFPSFTGHPAERLRKLNDHVRELGWAGTGLWIAAQLAGDGRAENSGRVNSGRTDSGGVKSGESASRMRPESEVKPYWTERARWCGEAEIRYWKVDWGERSGSIGFRRLLSTTARSQAPNLFVEHAALTGPVNDPEDGSGRYSHWTAVKNTAYELLSFSDVVRGYDILYQMPTATMLDRIATLLGAKSAVNSDEWKHTGYLNAEDEVYLGATLGCALGIMRHPPLGCEH